MADHNENEKKPAGERPAEGNFADKNLREKEPTGENSQQQLSEEEIREKLEEHFRQQQVSDVLVQFLVSLSSIAYIKMGLTEDSAKYRDMDQASLAIDAFQGLLQATEKRLPSQEAQALAGALASMQITFARSSGSSQEAASEPEAGKKGPGSSSSGKSGGASRLWVPGKD